MSAQPKPVKSPPTAVDVIDHLRTELAIEEELTEDTPLFSSGLLDSVAMMGLIMHLEEITGGDVRPADVTLDNFDTAARIAAYAAGLA